MKKDDKKKIVDEKDDELDEKNLDKISGGAGPGSSDNQSGMNKPKINQKSG